MGCAGQVFKHTEGDGFVDRTAGGGNVGRYKSSVEEVFTKACGYAGIGGVLIKAEVISLPWHHAQHRHCAVLFYVFEQFPNLQSKTFWISVYEVLVHVTRTLIVPNGPLTGWNGQVKLCLQEIGYYVAGKKY